MNSPKESDKSRTRLWRGLLLLLGFAVAFSVLMGAYVYKFKQQLVSENKTHLTEASNHTLINMTTVVENTQHALLAVSEAVAALDTIPSRIDYLKKINEHFGFAYMGYAEEDGFLHATLDSQSVDVGEELYFQKAMRGHPTVSDQVRKILTHRAASGILLTIPIERSGRRAMLLALLETRNLRYALSLQSFGGEGYCYIVDRDGTVVMRTRLLEFSNLFMAWKGVRFVDGDSLAGLQKDIKQRRTGLVSFLDLVGARQYAYYQPLRFNNWTLVNVVSENAVTGKTLALTRELALLGGAMVVAFMALMFWAMRAQRASQESRLAAEAKSAFLANMSHEIRTPMNAIVGISEIMLRDDMSRKHKEQLGSILNSGKGLLTIINDILDLSKIEAGSFTIVDEVYELESLLYDVTVIAAMRIGDKPIHFLIELAPDLPRCLVGDVGRVKQVLLNIVGNAIKFTAKGHIILRLSAWRKDEGWLLHAEVEDSGMGIRQEDLGKMFERFSQVDTRRNRQVEGTGLGLTITRKLCEMMGGHISVSSTYGQGSTFFLLLHQGDAEGTPLLASLKDPVKLVLFEEIPLLRGFQTRALNSLNMEHHHCDSLAEFQQLLEGGEYSHALASRTVMRELAPELNPGQDSGGTRRFALLSPHEYAYMDMDGINIYMPLFLPQLLSALSGQSSARHSAVHSGLDSESIEPMPHVSVLIVDDNDLNIMVAEGLLAPYGMHIDHAFSGREAIQAVLSRDYDLVFMDHMMPEMDGVEALKHIRALPGDKFRYLPIVALTANTTAEARDMFMERGFDGFLSKPIETAKMHALLKAQLLHINTARAGQ